MSSLTRDELLAGQLDRREVKIKGGSVWVRDLSAAEAQSYLKAAQAPDPEEVTLMAHLVCLTACDENGRDIFTPEDIETVKGMSLKTLKPMAEEAARQNGFIPELPDPAKKKTIKPPTAPN
jgi:hypothetical protein